MRLTRTVQSKNIYDLVYNDEVGQVGEGSFECSIHFATLIATFSKHLTPRSTEKESEITKNLK